MAPHKRRPQSNRPSAKGRHVQLSPGPQVGVLVARPIGSTPQEPSDDAPLAFVIMPFSPVGDLVFDRLIRPIAQNAGYRVERADTMLNQRAIMQDVVRGIQKADLILADLSGRNPNVFYELGIAHALRRPTILLAQSTTDIPFDLAAYRVVIYSINFTPATTLQSPLEGELRPLLAAARNRELVFGSPFTDYSEPEPDWNPETSEGILDQLDRFVRVDAPVATATMERIGLLVARAIAAQSAVMPSPEAQESADLQDALQLAAELADVWTESADELEPLVEEELIPSILAIEKGALALVRAARLTTSSFDVSGLAVAADSMAGPATEFVETVRETSRLLRENSQWASSLIRPGQRLAAVYERMGANVERISVLGSTVRQELGLVASPDT